MQRLLEHLARERGLNEVDLFRRWNTHYAPIVHFIEVPPHGGDARLSAVAAMDPDDEPTARLALLVSPAFLLSKDKSLIKPGLATGEWLQVFIALQLAGAWNGLMICAAGSVALGGYGTYQLAEAAIRHPRLTAAVLAILAGALFTCRTNLSGDIACALMKGRQLSGQIGSVFVAMTVEREQAVDAVIGDVVASSVDSPQIRVMRTMARQRLPISASDVSQYTALPVPVVCDLLESQSAFVRAGRRWQLGLVGRTMPLESQSSAAPTP